MYEFPPRPARRTAQVLPANRLIGLKEAAAVLGVSAVTVRRRVRSGALPHIRISTRLYFKLTELNTFIEAHRGFPAL